MNRITPLLFLLFVSTFTLAQDCINPLSNAAFQPGFNQVASQTTNQLKLQKSLELVGKSCLLSSQVKNMAMLFTEDSYRLDFCRAAYLSTFDRVNFYDVFDAFTSLSYAIRLYDYTKSAQPVTVPAVIPVPVVDPVVDQPKVVAMPRFANLVYPAVGAYTGNKGCDGPVADDATFKSYAVLAASQPTDEAKYVAIQSGSENACYSLAQVMKVTSLIGSEKIRLKAMNETFNRVYDQDHFMSARSLFTSIDLQNQWVAAAKFALTPPAPTEVPCVVEDADVKAVITSIRAKNFPDEKMKVLEVVKKDKCFNVGQITTLTREFTFDNDKLTAMKKLYERCPDKQNYFKLADELQFAYLQDDLNQFIKKEGK